MDLTMRRFPVLPLYGTRSLTRLEAAEEAHAQRLQRIVTEDSPITGAVMIGFRTTHSASSSHTHGNGNANGNGNTNTNASHSTPRRRARRSESSHASGSGSGSSNTGNYNATSDVPVPAAGVAVAATAPLATTGTGTTMGTDAGVTPTILPASPTPHPSQLERFWNRHRREDSSTTGLSPT